MTVVPVAPGDAVSYVAAGVPAPSMAITKCRQCESPAVAGAELCRTHHEKLQQKRAAARAASAERKTRESQACCKCGAMEIFVSKLMLCEGCYNQEPALQHATVCAECALGGITNYLVVMDSNLCSQHFSQLSDKMQPASDMPLPALKSSNPGSVGAEVDQGVPLPAKRAADSTAAKAARGPNEEHDGSQGRASSRRRLSTNDPEVSTSEAAAVPDASAIPRTSPEAPLVANDIRMNASNCPAPNKLPGERIEDGRIVVIDMRCEVHECLISQCPLSCETLARARQEALDKVAGAQAPQSSTTAAWAAEHLPPVGSLPGENPCTRSRPKGDARVAAAAKELDTPPKLDPPPCLLSTAAAPSVACAGSPEGADLDGSDSDPDMQQKTKDQAQKLTGDMAILFYAIQTSSKSTKRDMRRLQKSWEATVAVQNESICKTHERCGKVELRVGSVEAGVSDVKGQISAMRSESAEYRKLTPQSPEQLQQVRTEVKDESKQELRQELQAQIRAEADGSNTNVVIVTEVGLEANRWDEKDQQIREAVGMSAVLGTMQRLSQDARRGKDRP